MLNWFRAGGSDLIGCRLGIERQGETDRQKSLWIENAARPRNRSVSPDGAHPIRAEIYPQILLRRLLFEMNVAGNVECPLSQEDDEAGRAQHPLFTTTNIRRPLALSGRVHCPALLVRGFVASGRGSQGTDRSSAGAARVAAVGLGRAQHAAGGGVAR